jgi:hypothetical protein
MLSSSVMLFRATELAQFCGVVIWQSVNSSLNNAIYTHSKVTTWQATIVENTLKRLAALNKPFKYVGGFPAPLHVVGGLGCEI